MKRRKLLPSASFQILRETVNNQNKTINKSPRQQQAGFWRIIKLHEGWRMRLAGRPPRVAGEGEWAGISASSFLQFSLVAQTCPTPCDRMDCSMPGLPVHHQFPELAQTHVHRVQPSNHLIPCHPLLLPSVFHSIRGFSKESAVCIR